MDNTSNRTLLIGYIQAFVAILVFLGINQVYGRYSITVWDINPIIYTCSAFASCALVLLGYAGHGQLAKETMRSFDTWSYGFILMMSYVVGFNLLVYVSATEATMLQKVSVFLGLLGSWFFLARRPDKFQIIGTLIITLGVIMVVNDITSPNKGIILILSFLYGGFQILRMFVAELHRPHSKAAEQKNDPRAKARVIAFVMFIISILFLAVSFVIALAQSAQEVPLKGLPVLSDFLHGPTIFLGMISGVLIIAPSRMLEFSSSHIIKAENFASVATLSFVGTLFWEWVTSPITGLSIKEISTNDMYAGALITLGGLIISLTRGYAKKYKQYKTKDYIYKETQNLDKVYDTRETVANALENLHGDTKKVAKALEVPELVIEKILQDNEKQYAFTLKVFEKVMRNYRKNISNSDALTGILNRPGFIAAVKDVINKQEPCSVLFLDLNKFKPVNDTYGHEAGDEVLKAIATRLEKYCANNGFAARLGGDEFTLMLKVNKDEAIAKVESLRKLVAEEIGYKEHTLEVGTSVGIASYPEDSENAMGLIKLADEQMYTEKSDR
tara:strand:+ start:2770 stop:4440 length:1671 start_codon:yes stop_codon:yes gene_type:complete